MTGDGTPASATEFLICLLARLIGDARTVAVGAASPIPAGAALLAQAASGGKTTAMILGSDRHGPFNDGGPELFDRAAQGRIDVFFLGGGQIDGSANINLVSTGDHAKPDLRLPGSFGAPYLYMLVPRTILFREEHSRRVLVPSVDFISAPGVSPPNLHRPGGPAALVTAMAWFDFDRSAGRFSLRGVHPGVTAQQVRAKTGFDYDCGAAVAETPSPKSRMLAVLRGTVQAQLAEIYPGFVRERLKDAR